MEDANELDGIQALEFYIEPQTTPEMNALVRKCHGYITNRLGQFDLKNSLEAKLPIGSGE
jgi:hypothetical protein